jgi:hypothetical protein
MKIIWFDIVFCNKPASIDIKFALFTLNFITNLVYYNILKK